MIINGLRLRLSSLSSFLFVVAGGCRIRLRKEDHHLIQKVWMEMIVAVVVDTDRRCQVKGTS
jgi:hypothetical protein